MAENYKPDAVGGVPVPQESDIRPRSLDKAKAFAENAQKAERGGPLPAPEITSPYQTVDDSPAYRRADATRFKKGE